MRLESLANELLLDLFEYLTIGQLVQSFNRLNSRFESLLIRHFQVQTFDFGSLLMNDFQLICQEYLPSMIEKITLIRLLNHDNTREQLNRFSRYDFVLDQFIQLKSFVLFYLNDEIVNKVNLVLPHLPNLTHLSFEDCNFAIEKVKIDVLVNTIWSLSNLSHCYFNHGFVFNCCIGPSVISSSIKHLSIFHENDISYQMIGIFEHTPNLESLYASEFSILYNLKLSSSILSITRLKLLQCSYSKIVNFIRRMINLCQLGFTSNDQTICDHTIGQQWKNIIQNYLTKLNRFQFRLEFHIDNEKQIDTIFNSFQNSFWMNEKDCFVQYDWHLDKSIVCFYTLPYAFETFSIHSSILSKSTYLHNDKQWFCDKVRRLSYDLNCPNYTLLTNMKFSKIENLSVRLPVTDQFWSIVTNFDRLISLEILSFSHNVDCADQLGLLLERAPCLSFSSDSPRDDKLIFRQNIN